MIQYDTTLYNTILNFTAAHNNKKLKTKQKHPTILSNTAHHQPLKLFIKLHNTALYNMVK